MIVRPFVRLAWRDIRLAPGRSALVMVMVGLPVAAVTAGSGLSAARQDDISGTGGVPVDPATAAVYALVLAAIGLQVVLMAGAAFAVGVRRQRRTLGLLAAAGADPGQLRRTVLAGGLVLGPLGAAGGLLVGYLGGRLAAALWRHAFPAPYQMPGSVLWIAVAAAGWALLATLAPGAQAARLPVVAALAGREGELRLARGWPLAGATLVAAGMVVTVLGVRQHEFGVAAGAVLTIVGLVLLTPAVVALTGQLGRRLPVAARFAVRDAARHRARTAPAVAAIVAAVAALTALGVAGNSDVTQERRDYQGALPLGRTAVTYYTREQDRIPAVARAITAVVPGADPVLIGMVETPDSYQAQFDHDTCRCAPSGFLAFGMMVADPAVLPLVTDRPADPAALAALAAGGTVYFADGTQPGTSRLGFTVGSHRYALPAVTVRAADPLQTMPATAMITPGTARRLGLQVHPTGWVLHARNLDADQRAALGRAVRAVDGQAGLYTETGPTAKFTVPALALGGIALLLVLGATLTATGLAAADANADLATMVAVGAAPRMRRLVAMSQAGVVAVLGSLVGVIAGMVPGIAVTWPLTANGHGYTTIAGVPPHGPVIDIPWLLLAGIAIGVPLLAVLASAATSPRRLPATRRLAR